MGFSELLDTIGGMGYYQIMQLVLTTFCIAVLGSQNFLQNFVAGVPEHYCQFLNQTGAESLYLGGDRSGDLLKASIPMDKEGKPERCLRFTEPQWHLLNANSTEEVRLDTEDCLDGWVYDKSIFLSSIVIEWDLVCSRKSLKSIIQTTFMGGQQVGSIIFGILSDRFGRRTVLRWSSLITTIAGTCAAFVPTFAGYAIFVFLSGVSCIAIIITSICLALEWTPLKTRMIVHSCNTYAFSVGQIILSGWAYLIREWRWLQFSISISYGIIFLCSLLLQESACWLSSHNKLPVAVKSLQKVVMSYIEEDLEAMKTSPFFTDLFRTPGIRLTTFCIMLEWFACGFSFYGVGLDLQKFGFSIYWVQVISALTDLQGKLLASISMSYLGRRVALFFLILFSGLMIIINIFVPQDMPVFQMVLSILGKGGLGGAISSLYLYTPELYPTEIRQIGMSAGQFFLRFGSLLAPVVFIISNYVSILKPLLFGIVPILSTTCVYFLTETRGLPFLETIEETENRVKRRYFLKKKASKDERDIPSFLLLTGTETESTVAKGRLSQKVTEEKSEEISLQPIRVSSHIKETV